MLSKKKFFVSSCLCVSAYFFSSILLIAGGCSSSQPASALPTTNMHLGKADFVIEIANTDPVRMHGLMERDSMPNNHGMIFVFPDEQPREFWMKNTRFPLDIAYLNSAGQIVSIKQMKAYDLTGVPSDGAAKYAIELNLGIASAAGLKPGDHIDIPPEAKDAKN
jgi:hypothetical protein